VLDADVDDAAVSETETTPEELLRTNKHQSDVEEVGSEVAWNDQRERPHTIGCAAETVTDETVTDYRDDAECLRLKKSSSGEQ